MAPYDAPLATRTQLARAHTMSYVRELIAAAPTEGHRFVDPDTLMNPHTVQARCAPPVPRCWQPTWCWRARRPGLSCNVRPPGHHAVRAAMQGFSFFNNVAVGIRHALDVHGLQRVALIDFDVHHGNGSADIFRCGDRVLVCSIFEKGIYPFSGEDG